MSIAEEILRLQNAKIDIKVSIENKGVTVPSNETIDNYPSYIDQITTGGGGGQDTNYLTDLIERDITSIVIPNNVTSIGDYIFYQCAGLTSINIPSGVTSIGLDAFYGCTGLTSINIPSGVTTISQGAFSNCTGLTSVTIPNSVTSIGNYGFSLCTSLASVTIGTGVTSIGYSAFTQCSSLTSVTIEATTPPTLDSNAFDYNASGRKIYVPSGSVETYKAASGWSRYASAIEAIPT